MADTTNVKLKLAEFLRQALELDDSAEALAGESAPFKEEPHASIWTIELDSSVGVAPFLIYHYMLETMGLDGRSGKEIFDSDLRTLERSAMIDTPGPRIMAHAVAEGEAFILATTPATHRVLTGQAPAEPPPDPAETDRASAANELLDVLANANRLAGQWLAALRKDGEAAGLDTHHGEFVEFNEAETALALYILDDRSIRDLLAVLNLMIESARGLADID